MKNNVILSLLLLFSLFCNGQQTITTEVEKLLKAELAKEPIKSAIIHVYSESKNINFQFAEDALRSENSVTTNSPFYTASITKMLTATSIGILKDRKMLNFNDKIALYLSEAIINNLHVLNGKTYSKDITIAQLLQHTSGLPDYFTGETIDGSPNIINQLLIDKEKLWSPQEMIQFTKEHMKPNFVPGQGYNYTDTEYVLLALIIEKVSGLSLDQFFQQYIFDPLGMKNSYMNLKSSSQQKEHKLAEFYVGDIELSTLNSLSADWGGGGLVATTQDLISFLKGFNKGLILTNETRLEMQNWMYETVGMEYGYGLRKVSIKDLMNIDTPLQLIGHTGSTASFLWYCPQLDTYVTGTLNQLEASKSSLILVYNILKQLENK
ncbi:beta-lactamase family protein [Rasiella rasia]|uniref:Beta-lactamase family protein n=1 Tax=Rasiella rasia TaxID=2744027 RepID=A0A6G6GIF9_9FLAO|nr:serine hydrolase domain-containing protein [Rasiella rasia]QIE58290.1 beta-lactamase family protein [Rasiella rasia]